MEAMWPSEVLLLPSTTILRVTYSTTLCIRVSWKDLALPSALYQDPARQAANEEMTCQIISFLLSRSYGLWQQERKPDKKILRNSAQCFNLGHCQEKTLNSKTVHKSHHYVTIYACKKCYLRKRKNLQNI